MIAAYWERGGPLPNNPQELARICRTSSDKLARWGNPVIAMFSCKDNLLYHQRIDSELSKACLRSAKGIAGSNARWHPQAMLPTTTSIKEEDNILSFNGKVPGKSNGNGHVTIKDPKDRLDRFQKWLAEAIGGPQGWVLVDEAADPAKPNHLASLAFCKAEAKRLGKGWPNQWPAR